VLTLQRTQTDATNLGDTARKLAGIVVKERMRGEKQIIDSK
jgi:hypothetical protein